MDKIRNKFELWMATKGKSEMEWNGKRYGHPRIQMQWIAFCTGWAMGNE